MFLLVYVSTNSIWALHKVAVDQNLQICNLTIIQTAVERLEPVDVWIIAIYIILHTLVTFPKQMDRCLEKCTNSVSFWIKLWIIVMYIIFHTLVTFPKQMDRCLEKCSNSVSFWVEFVKDLRQEFHDMYSSPLSVIHWFKCFARICFI